MAERGRGRGSGFWARDYGENGPVFGQFHQKCGEKVVLTEGRTVASGSTSSLLDPFPSPPIAFSNDPIPKGVPFSVKVLQEGKEKALRIGVTAKDPDSGFMPGWGGIDFSDHYWFVYIRSDCCKAQHKRQQRELQWVLDRSAGNTFGCHVSGRGELYLHHNGSDVGVAWEGIPTYQPLWGFVVLHGYKVESNYVIRRVSQTPSSPSPPIGAVPTSAQPKGVVASSTAEDVLNFFRDSFIKWTDANTIVYDLRHREIISDGVLTEITRNPNPKQQNEILHRCLTRSCNKEALMEVCDIMSAVVGNCRMKDLGQEMKLNVDWK